jgi:hypothetical protein
MCSKIPLQIRLAQFKTLWSNIILLHNSLWGINHNSFYGDSCTALTTVATATDNTSVTAVATAAATKRATAGLTKEHLSLHAHVDLVVKTVCDLQWMKTFRICKQHSKIGFHI